MIKVVALGLGLLAVAIPISAQVKFTEFFLSFLGNPQGITPGPDGALWFFESGKIGRITTGGAITDFSVMPPIYGGRGQIATGPDGNVWFTGIAFFSDGLRAVLGRITTSGKVTLFPIPEGPISVIAGPDGNLWITEGASNIGRISTSGVPTHFPIPSGGSGNYITVGPDGNLWFTESDKIGRITVSGAITEFPIPAGNVNAAGIVAGADGNLWFTESDSNKIGRITTSGVIMEFSVPTVNSRPGGITAGPDGNLWFTESAKNRIGATTTSGAITEFPLPYLLSVPAGITTGPDGNIWFTETIGQKIGRLSLVPCTAAPGSVTALNIERAIPLANVLTTFASAANPVALAAITAGKLEIREQLIYNPATSQVASKVFLVPAGSPLPSPGGAINGLNLATTIATVNKPVTSCARVPSLTFNGTVSGSTPSSMGFLYGGSLVGASYALSLGYTLDTPAHINNVTETVAGVVTLSTAGASGTLTVPNANSISFGGGGAGPAIVVKDANGVIAVPNSITQVANSPFLLDASGSSSSGGAVTFEWSTVSNSPVQFQTADTAITLVQFPSAGDYVIQLKVTDASGASSTFNITLEFTGRPQ